MEWKEQAQLVVAGHAVQEGAGIFGVNVPVADAALVLLPAPWDGTASYGKGTVNGPKAILKASHQLDYFDLDYGAPVCAGIAFADTDKKFPYCGSHQVDEVNLASHKINQIIYDASKSSLLNNQLVGVVGGEHSVPFGLIKALSEKYNAFGILHIDAHHDLRDSYEGYLHSHASIMFNVLQSCSQLSKLTSVGIRDFSIEEFKFAHDQGNRVRTFYDRDLQDYKADGKNWGSICKDIIGTLPEYVYISFDIDGLEPVLCPHTGTPVPGGLTFAEADRLMRELVKQGKKIIGFDLCEVAPDGVTEWDANVGARVLYKLCGAALASQGKKVIV